MGEKLHTPDPLEMTFRGIPLNPDDLAIIEGISRILEEKVDTSDVVGTKEPKGDLQTSISKLLKKLGRFREFIIPCVLGVLTTVGSMYGLTKTAESGADIRGLQQTIPPTETPTSTVTPTRDTSAITDDSRNTPTPRPSATQTPQKKYLPFVQIKIPNDERTFVYSLNIVPPIGIFPTVTSTPIPTPDGSQPVFDQHVVSVPIVLKPGLPISIPYEHSEH